MTKKSKTIALIVGSVANFIAMLSLAFSVFVWRDAKRTDYNQKLLAKRKMDYVYEAVKTRHNLPDITFMYMKKISNDSLTKNSVPSPEETEVEVRGILLDLQSSGLIVKRGIEEWEHVISTQNPDYSDCISYVHKLRERLKRIKSKTEGVKITQEKFVGNNMSALIREVEDADEHWSVCQNYKCIEFYYKLHNKLRDKSNIIYPRELGEVRDDAISSLAGLSLALQQKNLKE